MFLKYGQYQHAAGEAAVVISRQGLFAAGGAPRGVRERWDIRGRLQAADQAALDGAIAALSAAYAAHGRDIGFYFDDGQPTAHRLVSADAHGGVRVVVPPSFPEGRGAEYSTFRTYALAVEAEMLDPQAALVGWTESLTFQGGGPQFMFLEPLGGLPQKQMVKQATTYRATQSGSAVGQLAYPVPPAPLWPSAELVDHRQIRYELPRRTGPAGSPAYSEFKVSWSYSFADARPLFGLPTPWPR